MERKDSTTEENVHLSPSGTQRVLSDPTQISRHQAIGPSSKIYRICQIFSVAAFSYTTKQLMTTYKYPLTLSFGYFAIILLVHWIRNFLRLEFSNFRGGRQENLDHRVLKWKDTLPNTNWLCMLPASFTAAATLPILLEGVLHMPSLSVLIMLLPTHYVVEQITFSLAAPRSKSSEENISPWSISAVVFASFVILSFEYRLMVPGLIWGVGGILLFGITKGLFRIGVQVIENGDPLIQALHGFSVMLMCLGLLFSAVAGYFVEGFPQLRLLSKPTAIMMLINAVCLISGCVSGYTPFAYALISPRHRSSSPQAVTESYVSNFLTSFASGFFVLLASLSSNSVVVIFWPQIISYLVASACVMRVGIAHKISATGPAFRCINSRPKGLLRKQMITRIILIFIIFTGTAGVGLIIFSVESVSLQSLSAGQPTNLDLFFEPSSQFDIVISAYDESPDSIQETIAAIKVTKHLITLQPRVILYTKHPTVNLSELKISTGADIVRRLENIGREGGTYLHHIFTNWDDLAEQTMFLQAHAHNMRELIPRINSYLVPETGMLSLGFTGILCECGECEDRWGWEDKWKIVPGLYQKIYNHTCDSKTPVLLSYKGQFVASARRIRGIRKSIYEELLKAIMSEGGWSHDPTKVGLEDSTDNPSFGFTVERVWSLLMQCATDGRVAALCPSLLSGRGISGKIQDCQCLDME